MDVRHIERLRRARDLLSVKGYDTATTVLTCYSGAGFSEELTSQATADPHILLVGCDRLYGRELIRDTPCGESTFAHLCE